MPSRIHLRPLWVRIMRRSKPEHVTKTELSETLNRTQRVLLVSTIVSGAPAPDESSRMRTKQA